MSPTAESAGWPVNDSQARLTQASLRAGSSQKTGSHARSQSSFTLNEASRGAGMETVTERPDPFRAGENLLGNVETELKVGAPRGASSVSKPAPGPDYLADDQRRSSA